ncbi:ankyrin repeat, SAM and basic leucine zipper domain-containing protein 1-like isoform X1 [Eriocheir sinensis]|uniref:ankyrin repeat, SAM and basic leucine zipper domain-containing protein 1-like isoform X1 n=2 Tax=Eriocheir sinensis TaxID=95602 RepID=UPI0021C6AE42|nr:ankyrin repeat, SAM and basic leucine zipper domain-containing protein 1-like isoform X1 [Eriocheir sinensis]
MWGSSDDEMELVGACGGDDHDHDDDLIDMTPVTSGCRKNGDDGSSEFFNGAPFMQSVSSMGSDAANERNQEAVDGESLWSSEPTVNGHSLSLPADHHNGYLKAPSPAPSCGSTKSRSPGPHRSGSRREIRMHEGHSLPLDELRMAAMHGNLPVVKALLKQGVAVDQVLKGGWTCLLFASSSGRPQVVDYVLQQGANANMHKELFTPLMAACASSRESESDLLECVNLLLSYGAKPDIAERHRMTPLMFASKEGRVSLVQRLIDAKVDVNKQDNRGWSALSWAATRGHGRVVRLLLQHSADPTRMNSHGQRPADIALAAGFPQVADILERFSAQWLNGSVDTSILSSVGEAAATSAAPPPSALSKMAETFGELEMVLTGLNLPDMIPVFRQHQVTFEVFLRLTEKDLENMNITAVGVRKSILQAIKEINKKEWETSSLPNVALNTQMTLPECAAIMTNIDKHIRYMHATVGYLRDQLQANPKVLQLGQETHTVASLASQCGDALKHLRGFSEEVKFLKCHLDKISGDAEHTPADLIVERADSGRVWQRRLLASLATTTALATVVWYSRPSFFARLFNLSAPHNMVTLDI